jgi:hypothetical protein
LTIGFRIAYLLGVEENRLLRRQPEDHNFGSLLMLSAMTGGFPLATWVPTKVLFFYLRAFES